MTLPPYDPSEGFLMIDHTGRLVQVWRLKNGRAMRDPEHAARVVQAWWHNERDRLLGEPRRAA